MILLPPSLLCGLDPTQLAAILSHEMAHIRRYDLLFNLFQRFVESLLFFIRSHGGSAAASRLNERIAAMIWLHRKWDDFTYAHALVQMASICLANHRPRSQTLATLAADGGNSTDFGYRIRRLIDAQERRRFDLQAQLCILFGNHRFDGSFVLSIAQSPQTQKDESQVNQRVRILWSTAFSGQPGVSAKVCCLAHV